MSGFRINLDKFDAADRRVSEGLSDAVRALAFAVQARAVDEVELVDAIDTGALRASIYVSTEDNDGRPEAVAEAIAEGRNPGKKSGKPQPKTEIALEGTSPSGEHEAKVGVCVNYGIYVEMGVENAFGRGIVIPARPYLLPAAESVREDAAAVTRRFIEDALR